MEKDNHFILKQHFEPRQHRHNGRFKKHIRRTEHVEVQVEDDRTGMSVETLKRAFADNLYYLVAKDEYWANLQNYYTALAYTVRDRLLHRWIQTTKTYFAQDVKAVFYLSAEFLMGRQLGNNLISVGLYEQARQAVEESDFSR
jgi:starch phosphorylase